MRSWLRKKSLTFLEKFELVNKIEFGFRRKSALLKPRYLFLRASGTIGRMVLQKLKLCSSITKKHWMHLNIVFFWKNKQLGIEGSNANFFEISSKQKAAMCKFRKYIVQFCRSLLWGTTRISTWTTPFSCLLFVLIPDNTVVKQNREPTIEAFSQSLDLVSDYFIKNKLTMNYKKSRFMNMKAIKRSSLEQIKMKEINLTQR